MRKSSLSVTDNIFLFIGKVVACLGAFFAFFYTIGYISDILEPLVNVMYDLVTKYYMVIAIAMFAFLVVFSFFLGRRDEKRRKAVVRQNKEIRGRRPLQLFDLASEQ